jgi:hypothetical protein
MKKYLLFILPIVLISCQKTIKVDLPDVEQSYVVEGTIETNNPPFVILTQTQGYFETASAESIFGTFVHGATVEVTSSTGTYPLSEICSQNVPDSLLADISALTGIPEEFLSTFNYCVYTSLDAAAFGQEGEDYDLYIDVDGESMTSSTHIPASVPLDSTWFKPVDGLDSLGFVWASLADPVGEQNYYRWFAQRINQHTFGEEIGTQKDPFPIAPVVSVFDDKFFNGITFDFFYNRGEIGNLEGQDDEGPEERYFKSGDTIVVKFVSTTRENFLYIRSLENQAATAGSPFASPGNLVYNIDGGLGIWAGLAPAFDTLVCP